ncbi:hypothetical protein NL676_019511 [Syzygium grande]|nr:hypothetical protein NL676_019511 [Syzygium grande]
MNVNAKNLEGLTALDIFHDLQERFQHDNNEEAGKFLRRAKAKRASRLSGVTRLADYLSQELTIFEWQDRYFNNLGNGNRYYIHASVYIRIVVYLLVAAVYCVPVLLFSRHDKLQRRIDTPKRGNGNCL